MPTTITITIDDNPAASFEVPEELTDSLTAYNATLLVDGSQKFADISGLIIDALNTGLFAQILNNANFAPASVKAAQAAAEQARRAISDAQTAVLLPTTAKIVANPLPPQPAPIGQTIL
jgi:hypothetical protein